MFVCFSDALLSHSQVRLWQQWKDIWRGRICMPSAKCCFPGLYYSGPWFCHIKVTHLIIFEKNTFKNYIYEMNCTCERASDFSWSEYYLEGIGIPIVGGLGMFGNAASIVVLRWILYFKILLGSAIFTSTNIAIERSKTYSDVYCFSKVSKNGRFNSLYILLFSLFHSKFPIIVSFVLLKVVSILDTALILI